ncbi:type II secretion system minor pseudopilin GspK [Persephonella sp.]
MLLVVVLILIGSLSASLTITSEDSFILNEYVERTIEYEELYQVSQMAVDAVKELLQSDDKTVDYIGEVWSQNFTVPADNLQLSMVIVDQERYLNPNYLVNGSTVQTKYLRIFEKLFEILGINQTVLYNIIDWIDKNDYSNGGAERYPDYPAKNEKLDSLEELKLIGGITEKVYSGTVTAQGFVPGLRSILSVYSNGKVNVNTASKWVLMSLDPDIDETLASGIIAYRKEHPFKNINDLNLVEGITGDIIHRISPVIDVKSENFLVELTVKSGDREYKIHFLLERKGNRIKEKWRKIF